jgi:glycosyltransferase involved in cell wall biosynthesis
MNISGISVVITAHNEGSLLLECFNSVEANLQLSCLISSEIIISLDLPDVKTNQIANELVLKNDNYSLIKNDFGDVGLSRQSALNFCKNEYVAFVDSDDIWGAQWLSKSISQIKKSPNSIFHPELTIYFDNEIKKVRRHQDSTSRTFNKEILYFENLWTSSFITPKKIMLDIPMKGGNVTDRSLPYAYEDWSWFRETLIEGYSHRVVKKTVHFQRIKAVSNTSKSLDLEKKPWPISIEKFLN